MPWRTRTALLRSIPALSMESGMWASIRSSGGWAWDPAAAVGGEVMQAAPRAEGSDQRHAGSGGAARRWYRAQSRGEGYLGGGHCKGVGQDRSLRGKAVTDQVAGA